jgi:transcriptional regulator with XRE-family HTH domain
MSVFVAQMVSERFTLAAVGSDARQSAAAIGNRVRSRRLSLGLSQRELATPGVSYAYISRIEAGMRRPSVRALRKLAPTLGVSVAWLETGVEDPGYELAQMVLEHAGSPPRGKALALARRVVAEHR